MMVVVAITLAALLICLTGILSTSLVQMQRNQVVDTYEALYMGVEESDIETLKELQEIARVGSFMRLVKNFLNRAIMQSILL